VSRITLVNQTDQSVAFKLKTNSPVKFSVKPVIGVIQASGSLEVYGTISHVVPMAV
jgi:hypothetical protein